MVTLFFGKGNLATVVTITIGFCVGRGPSVYGVPHVVPSPTLLRGKHLTWTLGGTSRDFERES